MAFCIEVQLGKAHLVTNSTGVSASLVQGIRTVSYEASCVLANVLPFEYRVHQLACIRGVKSTGVFQTIVGPVSIQRNVFNIRHPAVSIRGFVDLDSQHNPTDFCIYTDGSKSDDGVGSAFVVFEQSIELHHRIYSLPDNCSVFHWYWH